MRYAIGDIHGCARTLKVLIEEKLQVTANDQLIFLGDYIDRGSDSKAVIDYIQYLDTQNISVVLLRGNHEDMFLKALNSYDDFILWLHNGAHQALNSFGIHLYTSIEWNKIQQIPADYIHFIRNTLYYYSLEDYFLVHAGLNFYSDDPFSDYHSMVWIRDFEKIPGVLDQKTLVHAHTPTPVAYIIRQVQDQKTDVLNLDGGCVFTQIEDLGHLVALNLDTREIIYTPNVD